MNTIQRIAKNTIILIIGDLATAIIGFFFVIYVARYLGVGGFGVLSFALAFTAIFNVLTDIGLSTLTTREVAREKSLTRKYLGNIGVLKIVLATATFGLISLTINLLDYPEETILVVYLVGLSVIISSFSLMFYSIFRAYERMEFVTLGQFLDVVLRLSGALFAISQGLGIVSLAFIYLAASVVVLIFNTIISMWKFAKPEIKVDFGFWLETLKQAWPMGLAGVFVTSYYWADSVMLSLMRGDEAVGWYNAAYRPVLALIFIPNAYAHSIFPVMSRLYISSRESLKYTYRKSLKYLLIIAAPIGVGTTLIAEKVIILTFGIEYSPSTIALQILIWSLVLMFINGVCIRLFNSLNKQTIVAIITGGSLFLNVVLNVILIPRYSYIGASLATVIAQFVALVIALIWSFKLDYGISVRIFSGILTKVLISAAAMGVFVYYCQNLALWWLIPSAALLYFIVLFIMRGTDKEDINLLRQVLGRRES